MSTTTRCEGCGETAVCRVHEHEDGISWLCSMCHSAQHQPKDRPPLSRDQLLADTARALRSCFPDRAEEMVAALESWMRDACRWKADTCQRPATDRAFGTHLCSEHYEEARRDARRITGRDVDPPR